jgi:hypothetical protein
VGMLYLLLGLFLDSECNTFMVINKLLKLLLLSDLFGENYLKFNIDNVH